MGFAGDSKSGRPDYDGHLGQFLQLHHCWIFQKAEVAMAKFQDQEIYFQFNPRYAKGFQMRLKLKENQDIGWLIPDNNMMKSKIVNK